jgi:hypothetical protein
MQHHRRPPPRAALLLSLLAAPFALPGRARATPRPLPFGYPYETLPQSGLEVEEVIDTTPVRALDGTGAEHWLPRSRLVTEIEYGITSRLELGFYLQFVDEPGTSGETPLRFDGLKQRLRYRFAEPGAWPIEVAIYGEVAELKNEIELEGKLILQRRFGPLRLISNLWAEREFYFSDRREWVLHPTLGAVWELRPALQVGVEAWMVQEIADEDEAANPVGDFNAGPLGFVGPTLMWQTTRLWITVGAYLRVTDFDRGARIGDLYGRLWVRTMLGIDL